MARALDGIALLTYFRRLKLSKEAQELLTRVRTSPPSRTPGARRGNMPIWYPSKKMHCIIKAESHKVEFAFLLQVEHDDDVLEVWDQPPSIQLEYQDRRGRTQRPLHTADYFLFRYKEAGWVECKPTQELIRQARTRPNRYQLDEQGKWRCPPGEAFAAKHGLFYEVYASDQINWAVQDNWLFLEDYYQDLDRLQVAERVQQWADEEYDIMRHPALGMTPREAYELSLKRDGERLHKHIEYDDTFLKATFPTIRKGKVKVEPGVGVRMNYLDYWCEAMRDPTVEGTQVKVRYNPFDVSVGYAYIDGRWRKCDCPSTEFAGCSERELQLLTEELRKRNRLHYGREHSEVTQKQLASFRRENADIETILRQQRHDRETRAALVVLEGGKRLPTPPPTEPHTAEEEKGKLERESSEKTKKVNPYENLLVLRRIEL